MPSINLLILPLIGAYFLITNTHLLNHRQKLLDSQRLIFFTILWSFFLLSIAFIFSSLFKYWLPEISYPILKFIPIKEKLIGTCILSFLLGLIIPLIINRFVNEPDSMISAVRKYGNRFQNLLLENFIERDLLMVSLRNGKVYVGFVNSFPTNFKYFELSPVLSGYRDERHTLVFTTNYAEAYQDFIDQIDAIDAGMPIDGEDDIPLESALDQIELTICSDEIISASTFNPELYNQFNPKIGDEMEGQRI